MATNYISVEVPHYHGLKNYIASNDVMPQALIEHCFSWLVILPQFNQ